MNVRILSGANWSFRASHDVIVKLKSDDPTRRTMAALAVGITDRSPGSSFEHYLSSKRVEFVEPLFPDESAVRAMASDRVVLGVSAVPTSELAGLNVFRFKSPVDAAEAVTDLEKDRCVEYAHLAQERFLALPKATDGDQHGSSSRKSTGSRSRRKTSQGRAPAGNSPDPLVNRQWGLRAVELFKAREAKRFREASGIVVAVIDTGVDPDHPDLQGIVTESKNFTSGPSHDLKGHGTHVTGIIAALNNNKVGISGVCQSRKIMSLKALGPYDGPGYYRAIRHATDRGAQVINFSLGGNHDPTEELLIKRALDRGVIIVAAMGNGFPQTNAPSYPAALDGVIAVGASTEVDRKASFSQTGKHISLVAPGVNIVSTVPTYPSELSETTDYDSWPGTSMATPFVTATVALLLARNSRATRAKVVSAIIDGADKIGGATGFSEELGHGRLNIRRSLAAL